MLKIFDVGCQFEVLRVFWERIVTKCKHWKSVEKLKFKHDARKLDYFYTLFSATIKERWLYRLTNSRTQAYTKLSSLLKVHRNEIRILIWRRNEILYMHLRGFPRANYIPRTTPFTHLAICIRQCDNFLNYCNPSS